MLQSIIVTLKAMVFKMAALINYNNINTQELLVFECIREQSVVNEVVETIRVVNSLSFGCTNFERLNGCKRHDSIVRLAAQMQYVWATWKRNEKWDEVEIY